MKKSGFTLIEGVVATVTVLTLVAILTMGFFAVKGCLYVKDNGIKNVAQAVRYGGDSD